MNIMLLDDHELFAKSVEFSLTRHSIKVKAFTNYQMLLVEMKKSLPNILLLDIHLGNLNGLNLAKELLTIYPTLKIVFLSAYNFNDYHLQAIHLGAKGFMNKNISIESLKMHLELINEGKTLFPKFNPMLEELTKREQEVLRLLAKGEIHQEIANKLNISRRTVTTQIEKIHSKFNVNSNIAAVVRGMELGIVPLPLES